MTSIIKKDQLSDLVYRLRLHAPRIAKKRRAGQFIILRPTQSAERIPLTIANANAQDGWIEIIFQKVGKSTRVLADLAVGESISDLAGPLGRATHIENFGKCLCIGGGVGIAPLYPIVNALHSAGNNITTILGARSSNLIILEDEMRKVSTNLYVATDDGSRGIKGFALTVFDDLIKKGEQFDFAIVIGPVMMMKFTSIRTVAAKIKTMVSLNPIMIDGTGMCGGCRVGVGTETKFACVDGPEFDASAVRWDELIARLNAYKHHETTSMDQHECRLEGAK